MLLGESDKAASTDLPESGPRWVPKNSTVGKGEGCGTWDFPTKLPEERKNPDHQIYDLKKPNILNVDKREAWK